MSRLERAVPIIGLAGLTFFGFALLVAGILPIAHLSRVPVRPLEEVVTAPSYEFIDAARRWPAPFQQALGAPTVESYRAALRQGRDVYIAEGCWHCHSQFTRPVSGEELRFGKVASASEYMNELHLPQLFGTRRVGPDLIRESGRHANDWHAAHLWDPRIVVPTSVMPRYPWLFDGETPNARGLALIAYLQWLGSWVTEEAPHAPR